MTTDLPRRGYAGLVLGTALTGEGGLVIRSVLPRSAAELAGARPGDVLLRLDENPVLDILEVRHLLRSLRAGDPLVLEVLRGGARITLETLVASFPKEEHPGAHVLLGAVDRGGHCLRTIAVVPDAPGPHPVVYFLPGAHWASEEYPLTPEHPVPSLLGALARSGIASIRVERSGLGDSQGPPCTRVDFETELAGYQAGLRCITQEPWADPARLFLFGHSLGAMVAPLLAESTTLAGIVTYGASALPISEALVGAVVRHAQRSPGDRAALRARADGIAELIRRVIVGEVTPDAVFEARPDLAAIAPSHFSGDQAYERIVTFYHQLERVDVARAWGTVVAPSLFIHGGRDFVSTAADSEALARLTKDARVARVPEADHLMSDSSISAPPRLCRSVERAVVRFFTDALGRAR